jgi:ABC-type transporter Mla subunit MlaD
MNSSFPSSDLDHLQKETRRHDQIGHLIRSIMRMKSSIAERMQEQATLLETSTTFVSTLDQQTVLDRILEQMGRLLSIQMYAIIALDEEKGS